MAGYSKSFILAGEGGFMGTDWANPIHLIILVGEGGRQWLQPVYVNKNIKPMGRVGVIIPPGPDDPRMLLDACLAFAPELFLECPSLIPLMVKLNGYKRLDFDHNEPDIAEEWDRLRQEARPIFQRFSLWECDFKKLGNDSRWRVASTPDHD